MFPVVKWLVVASGFALLCVSVYKLMVIQDVSEDGRIKNRFKKPDLTLRKPSLALPETVDLLSESQKKMYSSLYRLQNFIFGVLLFMCGLSVLTLAGMWLFNMLIPAPGSIWSVLTAIFGLGLMSAGAIAVFHRDKHNPFVYKS